MPKILHRFAVLPRALAGLLALAFLLAPPALGAQTAAKTPPFGQLALELGHPVYLLIEIGELRGALTRLSAVKPYSRRQALTYLEAMLAKPGLFSQAELARLEAAAEELQGGGPDAAVWQAPGRQAEAGVRVELTGRFDAGGLFSGKASGEELWHLNSRIRPYLRGELAPWLSVWGAAGFTFDKIERGLYLPYAYTKEWDAGHIDFSDARYSDGEKAYPSFSFDIQQDLAAATASGSLEVHLARYRRDWGQGSGSLALSNTARPFAGLEAAFRPSEFFALSHILGSLADWTKGENEKNLATDGSGNYSAISYQKLLAVQRLELFPFPWLTVGATSTLVGAKRFELGFLSPFLFQVMYQNLVADVDNLGVQVDGQIVLPWGGKLYASFYADEMEVTDLSQLFTKARNMFALQGGAKWSLPGLPFSVLTLQYTKIEPFVYAHYPTWYADYRLRVDSSYTHDGENLGYHLPPNSDEILLRFEALPAPDWRVSAEYSLVRHGDNPTAAEGEVVVRGDVTKWLRYTNEFLYMDKLFLEDGLYDYSHILKLAAAWRPLEAPRFLGLAIPMELGAGLGLSYTYWEANDSGEPEPSPEWKQVLELSAKFYL